jgi:hypothetical protein
MNSSWIKSLLVITPLSAVLTLSGCGSSSVVSPPVGSLPVVSPPSPTGFAESWHFNVSGSSLTVDAALTLSANSIIGVAHFQSFTATTPCPDGLPLSGTIDEQGQVSITSTAVMGVVLTLDGVLAPDHTSLSNGNYHFTGGCTGEQAGTLTGAKFGPLNGLYTGTVQLSGKTINVSAQLTQAAQSNSGGLFELSGTLTLSNGCDQTFNVTGSSVVGATVDVTSLSTGLEALTGVTDSEARQIQLNDYPYSDDCIAGAHGIIARQ